jgi:hypothetical protein
MQDYLPSPLPGYTAACCSKAEILLVCVRGCRDDRSSPLAFDPTGWRGHPPKLEERPSFAVACYGGWKGGLASANSAWIPCSLATGSLARWVRMKSVLAHNTVRKIREKRHMSKAELARNAGICPLTVNRIEKGMSCRIETKMYRVFIID